LKGQGTGFKRVFQMYSQWLENFPDAQPVGGGLQVLAAGLKLLGGKLESRRYRVPDAQPVGGGLKLPVWKRNTVKGRVKNN